MDEKLLEASEQLAMLVLQTHLYPEDYEIRKAVDDIIAITAAIRMSKPPLRTSGAGSSDR
jgi:hypothetical protein